MSRCPGFHRFFEFLELDKKIKSPNEHPPSAESDATRIHCKFFHANFVGGSPSAYWRPISIETTREIRDVPAGPGWSPPAAKKVTKSAKN